MFWTLLVLNLFVSIIIFFSLEQDKNIPFISVTLAVLKLLKFNSVIERQLENIEFIYSTFSVIKFSEIIIEVNLLQLWNKCEKFVTDVVLNDDRFK